MPWSHMLGHLPPNAQWPSHPTESMLSLIANNQVIENFKKSIPTQFPLFQSSSLDMNPLLQTFHHAASNNFGSVDLSMTSNLPIHPAYSLQPPPHLSSSSVHPANLNSSVIQSTASHKIGKITPIDTKILTGERKDNCTKSPVNSSNEVDLTRMVSHILSGNLIKRLNSVLLAATIERWSCEIS